MAEHGHQNKSQEEYNELLGMTQSLLGKMSDAMSELDAQTDKRNKKLSTQISLTKDIIGDLKNEKDLQAAINLLTQNANNMSSQNFGINQKLVGAYRAQVSALQAILQKQQDASKILSRVNSVVDSVKGSFDGVFKSIHDGLHHIPFIGEKMAHMFHPFAEKSQRMFGLVADKFKMGFSRAFQSSLAGGATFTKSFVSGITTGFGNATKLAMRFAGMLGPIGLAIIGIGAAIGLGWSRMHDLEEAATEFKTTTGLAGADLHDIEHTIGGVSNHFGKLGISAKEVGVIMSDYTTALDGMVIPAESTVAALAVMNKNFGVNAKSASEVNKVFQNMGGFSEAAATSLTMSAVEMANMVGVSPDQVIKDMADNAGEAYQYFRGSPQELVKAAVYAAKMGSSIKDMTASANKLLDFEESISKELEASALLGTNLDFSKARELAFTGDLLGMQKELTKELANVGDISKMSTYEKQALVDATGQELDTLMNTQRIYNKFGSLDDARLAAANDLIASGKDIANVSEAELEAQTERLAKQQKMQDMMGQLNNSMSAIGTAMGDAFAPVAQMFLGVLSGAAKLLAAVLIPAFQGLGFVIKMALYPFTLLPKLFGTLIEYARQYSDYIAAAGIGAAIVYGIQQRQLIVETALNVQKFIGTQLSKEGYFYKMYEFVQTKLAAGAQLIYNGYILVANAIKKRGLLAGIAEMAITAFSSLAKIPIVGVALGAVAAAGALALGYSLFSKAGDVFSPSDGKTRISTKEGGLFELSPNDDVLAAPGLGAAMQNGGGGGGGIVATSGGEGGGVATLINSLIAEMQGMRNDLATGKVAVYMDGQLVTSKIASVASKSPIT